MNLVMHKGSFGHTGIQIVRISRHSSYYISGIAVLAHLVRQAALKSMIIRKDDVCAAWLAHSKLRLWGTFWCIQKCLVFSLTSWVSDFECVSLSECMWVSEWVSVSEFVCKRLSVWVSECEWVCEFEWVRGANECKWIRVSDSNWVRVNEWGSMWVW